MGKLSVQEFCTAELVSNGLVRSVPISHVAVFPVSQGLAVVRYEQGTWTVMDGDVMCAFPYGQTRRCQRGPGIIAKLSMATQQDSSCCACTHTHTDSYRLNEEASILSIKCKDLLCISSALSNSKRRSMSTACLNLRLDPAVTGRGLPPSFLPMGHWPH